MFVPRGGTRDILIRFNVPARPESRAGRYDYVLEVETQVSAPQAGDGAARRKDRVTSLPAVANVRPFYKWGLDLTPEQRRVGRRRRSGEFEVVVTNEGNDWLYCDLQLPRPKDLLLDCPTLRLAVPPPEPGELLPGAGTSEGRPGTQRTVPLVATTRLKTFRGDLTPQPLMLTALRVDAPSLPPPPEDGFLSLGSVVATEPSPPDAKPAPPDRALLYAPPVPAKLLDFFSRGAGNFRAWIAPLLLIVVALPLAYALFLKLGRPIQLTRIDTLQLARAGHPLTVTGKWIIGSKVTIDGKIGTKEIDPVTLDSKPQPDLKGGADRCIIQVPKNLDGLVGHLTVHRADGLFSLFPSFISASAPITIGTPPPPPAVLPVTGPVVGGKTLDIPVQGIEKGATVTVGGKPATVVSATADNITVKVPDIATAAQCPITVTPPGGSPLTPSGPLPTGVSVADAAKQQGQQGADVQKQREALESDLTNKKLDATKQESDVKTYFDSEQQKIQALTDPASQKTEQDLAAAMMSNMQEALKGKIKARDEAQKALDAFNKAHPAK